MTAVLIINAAISLPVLAAIVRLQAWSIVTGAAAVERAAGPAPALTTSSAVAAATR